MTMKKSFPQGTHVVMRKLVPKTKAVRLLPLSRKAVRVRLPQKSPHSKFVQTPGCMRWRELRLVLVSSSSSFRVLSYTMPPQYGQVTSTASSSSRISASNVTSSCQTGQATSTMSSSVCSSAIAYSSSVFS